MNAWEMPQVQALGEERLRLMQEAAEKCRGKSRKNRRRKHFDVRIQLRSSGTGAFGVISVGKTGIGNQKERSHPMDNWKNTEALNPFGSRDLSFGGIENTSWICDCKADGA